MNRETALKGERVVLLVQWAAVLGFVLLMVGIVWPQYWRFVASETAPLAWLESVLLVLTAFVAGLIAFIESVAGRQSKKVIQGWIVVAAAFAWLALDERFALHERIRDRFLKPTGIRLLPWSEAGDWLIPLYMICGLAAVWAIWRLMGPIMISRAFFVAALLISACAVGMDTIDVRSLDKGLERLLQSVEEVLETMAMTSFLSAFLCVWMERMRSLLVGAAKNNVERDEPHGGSDVL